MCNPLNPACVIGAIAGSAFEQAAKYMLDAAGRTLESFLTFWTRAKVPDLADPSGTAYWVQDRLSYLTAAAAVVSVLIGGARLALTRRAEPGYDLAAALTRTALTAVCAIPVVAGLAAAGDAFSAWILDAADVRGLATGALAIGSLGPGLVLIGSLFIILSSLFQMALMLLRGAVITVMVGMLPLAAANTNTAIGRQWFSKLCAYLGAFLLFKPAAAFLYAAGMKLESSTDSATAALSGMFLLFMGVFALPLLVKLLVPATASLGSAGGGSVMFTAAAAAATGAVAFTGGGAAAPGAGGSAAGGGSRSVSGGTGGGSGAARSPSGAAGSSGNGSSGVPASGSSSQGTGAVAGGSGAGGSGAGPAAGPSGSAGEPGSVGGGGTGTSGATGAGGSDGSSGSSGTLGSDGPAGSSGTSGSPGGAGSSGASGSGDRGGGAGGGPSGSPGPGQRWVRSAAGSAGRVADAGRRLGSGGEGEA